VLLAQVEVAPIVDACGADPSLLCEFVFDRIGPDPQVVELVVDLVAVPLILVAALVVYRLARRVIDRFVGGLEEEIARRVERATELGHSPSGRSGTRRMQRLHAIGGALRGAVGIIVWFTALLLVLARFVDLRPILAGAGLAGLVVGFGAQNLIRDFLAGVSMLAEDQFGVGDWIEVDGEAGQVEHVGLRTTRFRDIDGVVWHVPNGAITKVGNLTQHWARATLDVPMALDTDVSHARRVIQEVADGVAADREWGQDVIGPAEIWGVQEWGPDGVAIRLVVPTRPLRNWDVTRQLRERLKVAFEQEGIRMPAPMRELGAQRTGEALRVGPPVEPPPRREPTAGARPEERDTTQRIPTVRPPTAASEPDED
jgi:moderate conductance mechanosensitive channel